MGVARRAFILGSLVAIAACQPDKPAPTAPAAPTPDGPDPLAVMDAIYARYGAGQTPPDLGTDIPWSPEMRKLYDAFAKRADAALPSDPFIDAQDVAVSDLVLSQDPRDAGRAAVVASYRRPDGQSVRVVTELVKIEGQWLIDDVKGRADSLRDTLRRN